jgi:hypothetical protein
MECLVSVISGCSPVTTYSIAYTGERFKEEERRRR